MINMFKVKKKKDTGTTSIDLAQQRNTWSELTIETLKKVWNMLTITTPKRRERRVFIDNFKNISQL